MALKGLQRPRRFEVDRESLTGEYGRFTAQPFERGFGTTIGNAMRRCLLSSIEGAAITAVQIEGVQHEFSSMAGVVEDVTDVVLNLKRIPLRMHSEEPKFLSLDAEGPGEVVAGMLSGDPQVEIVEPDLHIATLNEEGRLKLQAQVRKGRGYVGAERNFDEAMGVGWIPLDSVHSPVRRVSYTVEAARLGRATDYERLVLEIWTDGTVSPEEALSRAAAVLRAQLAIFVTDEDDLVVEASETEEERPTGLEAVLSRSVDELDLSVRSANALKNADIHTLRDLVQRDEKAMLDTKNFGKKSLEEVQEVLERLGLKFGMELPEGTRQDVGRSV